MATKAPKAAPSDLGLESTGDGLIDQALINAATEYNIPPAVMFATAQQESGLNPLAIGDEGTSFGLFQEHEGGELTSISSAENPQYAANLAAQTFAAARAKDPNATWGQIVAAAQRPANQQGYAADVNAKLGQAGNVPATQASKMLGSAVSSALMTPGGDAQSPGTINANLESLVTQGGGQMPLTGPGSSNPYQVIGNALSNPNSQSQLGGYILGQEAPQIASGELAESQALASAGLAPAAFQSGAANLISNAGYTEANALDTEQGLKLQGQSLATSIGTASQQQALEAQQYQAQLSQLTSAGGYIGTEEQQASQSTALAGAQIANQQAELAYQTPLALQAQAGQAASQGASNTVGNRNALGTIQEQANVQGTQLGLEQQQNTLAGQQTQAGLQQQGAQNAIQQQLAGLGQQSEVVGYQGQQSQYANSQQQLTLAAKQAGIPAQQANSQLAYGLQQLGISDDPSQFIGQAATAQSGIAGDYSAALSAAAVAGGLSPQFFSSLGGSGK